MTATENPPGPFPVGLRFTALLAFTQLPGVFCFTIALPLLANMAAELASDPANAYLAKLVAGILGPAMAVGALAGGWLAGMVDRRWLIAALGGLYVLTGVAPAFLESLEAIVATRFVTGLTAAALMAIGMTMVGDYLPEDKRAGAIGMLSALNMVASLVSMPAAGFVGDAGWRMAFLLYVAAAPVILLALPSALPVPARLAAIPGEAPARWYSALSPLLVLLALGIGIILTLPGIYVSFHLASFGLGKTSTVALLMMANSLVAAVFSALFGRFWRISPKTVFGVGFSTLAVGLFMLAYATGYGLALAAQLIMGIGMGLLAPSIMAEVVDTVDQERRGKIIGIVQGIAAVAPMIGITLFEPLLPAMGTKGAMMIIGVISAGFCLVYGLRRRVEAPPA